MKYRTAMLVASVLLNFTTHAQAALESRAGGTMVYDTEKDLTWVVDANLFKTLADMSGNTVAYVQDIIDANLGVVFDTPNPYDGNDGIYNLTASDFDTSVTSATNL